MVFLHPELQIGQQIMDHFMLAVVEALSAPGGVIATGTGMEILIIRTNIFSKDCSVR